MICDSLSSPCVQPRAVQRTKRVGDLSRVFQCLVDREWPLLQAFGEQLAFEVLKNENNKGRFLRHSRNPRGCAGDATGWSTDASCVGGSCANRTFNATRFNCESCAAYTFPCCP